MGAGWVVLCTLACARCKPDPKGHRPMSCERARRGQWEQAGQCCTLQAKPLRCHVRARQDDRGASGHVAYMRWVVLRVLRARPTRVACISWAHVRGEPTRAHRVVSHGLRRRPLVLPCSVHRTVPSCLSGARAVSCHHQVGTWSGCHSGMRSKEAEEAEEHRRR